MLNPHAHASRFREPSTFSSLSAFSPLFCLPNPFEVSTEYTYRRSARAACAASSSFLFPLSLSLSLYKVPFLVSSARCCTMRSKIEQEEESRRRRAERKNKNGRKEAALGGDARAFLFPSPHSAHRRRKEGTEQKGVYFISISSFVTRRDRLRALMRLNESYILADCARVCCFLIS